jgi:hypothetical protein
MGPVGYWSFNGADFTDKVYDRSDNANNGYAIAVATKTMKVIGKVGQGAKFVGNASSWIDLGNPSSLQTTGSLTVSAWVKADTPATTIGGAIVSKWLDPSGYSYALDVVNISGPRFGFELSADGAASFVQTSSAVVATSTWYHVAGVYDATAQTMNLYVNGTLDSSSNSAPPSLYNTSQKVMIGNAQDSVTIPWSGTIDEVRIYNRPLSASEVQKLYFEGK